MKIGKYKNIGIMKPFNFILTNQSIYILVNKSLKLIKVYNFTKKKEIKKKFSYFHIMAITSSNQSNEFIMHLNN